MRYELYLKILGCIFIGSFYKVVIVVEVLPKDKLGRGKRAHSGYLAAPPSMTL